MLKGIDVSNWNNYDEAVEAIRDLSTSFVIIKASEGATWRDRQAKDLAKRAADSGCEILFYHYCRPENGNSPESEMYNFIGAVNEILADCSYKDEVGLVLDWEGNALGKESWLEQAVLFLQTKYGIDPIVYCSASKVSKIGKFLDTTRTGLWVAEWNNKPGMVSPIEPWKVWAFHQYTNKPYDKDVFNGTHDQLKKYLQYAYKPEQYCECICNCCKAGDCYGIG